MHIYSVLNKLFTPKVEQNKVQDNTNEQKTNFQDGNKEKKYSSKPGNQEQGKRNTKTVYQETARVLFAKDGDTFLAMYNKEKQTFRLAGINAPEKGKAWSKEATDFLNETIKGKSVYLEILGEDKYGRDIVEVYLDKEKNYHVNNMLLQAGLATSERYKNNKGQNTHNIVDYTKNEITETVAQIKDVGIWSGEPPPSSNQDSGIFEDDAWRDQLNSENKSTKKNSDIKKQVNDGPVFNPFSDPPIEPLDVFPKGFSSNEEIILKQKKAVVKELSTEQIKIESTNSQKTKTENNEPVFNPFANPPIEPLDVFPKGITSNEEIIIKQQKELDPILTEPVQTVSSSIIPSSPDTELDINSIPDNMFFDDSNLIDNIPIDLDSMPSYIDDFPPMEIDYTQESIMPLEFTEDITTHSKIDTLDNQIQIVENKTLESKIENNVEESLSQNEVVPKKPKVILKIGAKSKPTIKAPEETIEPIQDSPVKVEISKPIIVEEKISAPEETISFKLNNTLSEDDPFSIEIIDSIDSNKDPLAILDEFDFMGEKIELVIPTEDTTTKKRKLGR